MSESVIADDLHIKGEVTTQGDIELKGTLKGEVTCRTLLIAEDARVEGKATAEKVVVRGAVDGEIHGIRVTLTSSARVKGELVCKALSVDEEAYFDGTSQRVNDPLGQVAEQNKRASGGEKQESKADKSEKSEKGSGDKLQPLGASGGSGSGSGTGATTG
ncbi:MAG: polymer-forming cytoskeletal protein [Hyphomicrobiaceae bacterium]|nr:polymer-forming cytoskeletal protein [Hyphomicrobiaceae bacterium]